MATTVIGKVDRLTGIIRDIITSVNDIKVTPERISSQISIILDEVERQINVRINQTINKYIIWGIILYIIPILLLMLIIFLIVRKK